MLILDVWKLLIVGLAQMTRKSLDVTKLQMSRNDHQNFREYTRTYSMKSDTGKQAFRCFFLKFDEINDNDDR